MNKETLRQLVHLSGLLFVFIAQFLDKWTSVGMFLLIGAFFLIYGEYVKRTTSLFGFRRLVCWFERRGSRPFTGAVWFYIGCGITFFLFPNKIASAASVILAIGDSFSTMIGQWIGAHKLRDKKSLEGTLAFFVFPFFITLFFVKPFVGMIGVFVGALVELFTPNKIGKKTNWLFDDNLLIPVISGAIMFWLVFVGA